MTEKLSILIVDDNRTNLALMDMLLRKLPNCSTQLHTDPQAVVAGLDRMYFDLAIFAAHLPQISGLELVRRVKSHPQFAETPILLTAEEQCQALKADAADVGAADVLGRPFDPVEFRARVKSLARPAEPYALPHAPRDGAWSEPAAAPQAASPREEEFLSVLVHVAGLKDRETPRHNQRVARYASIIAHHLGLPASFCSDIKLAAALHDIGKAGLSEELMRKRDVLTPEERTEMERHTRLGHAMLSMGKSPLFRMAADIALNHHERWDGGGYPRGIRGEQIPLAARITAVADVFDALTTVRPYKPSWTVANAFKYLNETAGEQFDPSCIAAFAGGREEVEHVIISMLDNEDEEAADAA